MNTTHIRFASNRLRDVRELFRKELAGLYPVEEVNAFFAMLCEEFLGFDTARMLLHLQEPINQSDLLRFHWALEDLLRERPIQHIIGHVDFCGCRIEVNESVLIPRPETEEIVQHLCRDGACPVSAATGETGQAPSLLDLCTGSGCIAIALKKAFPEAEVTAVDISEEALAVARRNAQANNVEINFLQADVLDTDGACPVSAASLPFSGETGHAPSLLWDLIVSNPPYVLDSERATMHRNVLAYDPSLALFVPDSDPLRFYRAIALLAQRHLAPEGLLALEINPLQSPETAHLLRTHGFRPEVHLDFRGKERLITARR